MSTIDVIKDRNGNFLDFLTAPSVGTEPGLPFRVVDGSSLNATARNVNATPVVLKATTGIMVGIVVINTSGAICYVQVHNIAAPTPGTTAPVFEMLCQNNQTQNYSIPDRGVVLGGTSISIVSTTTEMGAVGSAAGVQVFFHYL